MSVLKYITKSRVGLFAGLSGWILLFVIFFQFVRDYTAAMETSVENRTPIDCSQCFGLGFNYGIYFSIALVLISLGLATWGSKRDRRFSLLTYSLHIVLTITLVIWLW